MTATASRQKVVMFAKVFEQSKEQQYSTDLRKFAATAKLRKRKVVP